MHIVYSYHRLLMMQRNTKCNQMDDANRQAPRLHFWAFSRAKSLFPVPFYQRCRSTVHNFVFIHTSPRERDDGRRETRAVPGWRTAAPVMQIKISAKVNAGHRRFLQLGTSLRRVMFADVNTYIPRTVAGLADTKRRRWSSAGRRAMHFHLPQRRTCLGDAAWPTRGSRASVSSIIRGGTLPPAWDADR